MSIHNPAYVRREMTSARPAPQKTHGLSHWLRANLLATPKDVVLTLLAIAALAYILPQLVQWLFIDAVWVGTDRAACSTRPSSRITSSVFPR